MRGGRGPIVGGGSVTRAPRRRCRSVVTHVAGAPGSRAPGSRRRAPRRGRRRRDRDAPRRHRSRRGAVAAARGRRPRGLAVRAAAGVQQRAERQPRALRGRPRDRGARPRSPGRPDATTWSPPGRPTGRSSCGRAAPSPNHDLYRIRIDRARVRRLTAGPGRRPRADLVARRPPDRVRLERAGRVRPLGRGRRRRRARARARRHRRGPVAGLASVRRAARLHRPRRRSSRRLGRRPGRLDGARDALARVRRPAGLVARRPAARLPARARRHVAAVARPRRRRGRDAGRPDASWRTAARVGSRSAASWRPREPRSCPDLDQRAPSDLDRQLERWPPPARLHLGHGQPRRQDPSGSEAGGARPGHRCSSSSSCRTRAGASRPCAASACCGTSVTRRTATGTSTTSCGTSSARSTAASSCATARPGSAWSIAGVSREGFAGGRGRCRGSSATARRCSRTRCGSRRARRSGTRTATRRSSTGRTST